MKKIIILLSTLIALLQISAFAADNPIFVMVDDTYLSFDQPPIMQNDRVLVPLRAIFEALDATVEWDEQTQTITSYKGNTIVVMQIGNASYTVNEADKSLDVSPQIINGRTLVPVRAIAESFNCEVNWDDSTQTVVIESDVKIKIERKDSIIATACNSPGISVAWPEIIESTNPESMHKINEQTKATIDAETENIKPFIEQNFGYHLDYGIPNIKNNLLTILYTSYITMDGESSVFEFVEVYKLDTGEKAAITDFFPDMTYEEIYDKITLDFTMIIASEPDQYFEDAAEIISYNYGLAVIYPCGNEIVVTFNPGVIAPYELGFKTITYPAEY